MPNLSEQTKAQITKTFDFLLHQEFEYNKYSDSCKDLNRAAERVVERIEYDFEEFNNGKWVDPESKNYDKIKDEIVKYVATL